MSEQADPNLAADTDQVPVVGYDVDDPAAPPEAEGLPEYADDETPANHAVADPQRQPVPGETPQALEEYGTTAAEARHGESLAGRLAREEPDVAPGEWVGGAAAARAEADSTGAAEQLGRDADVLGERAEDPGLAASLEGDDPRTDSAVSLYERMRSEAGGSGAGELVAPDEGAHPDRERDEVARDTGGPALLPEEDAVVDEGPEG